MCVCMCVSVGVPPLSPWACESEGCIWLGMSGQSTITLNVQSPANQLWQQATEHRCLYQ